jgi:hypothetical protein
MATKQKSDAPDPSEAMPGEDADTLPEAEAAFREMVNEPTATIELPPVTEAGDGPIVEVEDVAPAQPDPQPVQSVIEHRSFGRPADEPVKVTTIRSN